MYLDVHSSKHNILDIGSGLGGPGRYIVHKTGCSLMAVELQGDLHDVAQDLTKRCGLAKKMTHFCGNILTEDLGMDQPNQTDMYITFLQDLVAVSYTWKHSKLKIFHKCFQM